VTAAAGLPRVTPAVLRIFAVLAAATPEDPAWGRRICARTGHGHGTVYPALSRMTGAGWLEDRWEEPRPPDRPRRRFYEMTAAGRSVHQAAVSGRRSGRES
jgi:PadR family transcriptional regulator PadR